jgi:hypothetical protein
MRKSATIADREKDYGRSVFDAHICLAEIGTAHMGAGFGTVLMRAILPAG